MDHALYMWVNRLADYTGWAHPVVKAVASQGLAVFAVLLVVAWWQARPVTDPNAIGAVGWAAIAPLVALATAQVIGRVLDRSRPYTATPGAHVLITRSKDFSFPSDHATAAAAIAAGLVLAGTYTGRGWVGRAAVIAAVAIGCSRVYVGVHYPGDVLGGLLLGAGITVIAAPLAMRLLRRITQRLARGRLAALVADRVR